ncbi:MAG: histidine kinase [Sphingobacteriaceae bacterium]|nr:histidine kinase [Cytophagaceae bacterium]
MTRVAHRPALSPTDSHTQALLDDLETERAITFFATSLLDQNTVDEVLWDVAKNCIARLQFVDCVVYWLDPERKVLVQKAAYGPKNPVDFQIFSPIEIPLGRGIVGSVGLTGRAERVGDTSKDSRYIQDDEVRFSEIAVPICVEGTVLGVIDAEHPDRDFFQPRHLKILSTIAALCAHKIARVEVEQAYRQTERQLVETNRRIAETKLLALRSQMNPHFVFNSLSSINTFILQNDPERASAYLTKFSRLLRQVLVNSRDEWVSLRNELEALKLYVELEQLRCDGQFDFELSLDQTLDTDAVLVPPLITQPFVENAIWHGLLPQKSHRPTLRVACRVEAERLLMIVLDNGIGRAAAALQSTRLTAHKSHNLKQTGERLHLINEVYPVQARFDLDDLYDETDAPAGTRVRFTQNLKHP